jgi:hypothetical protein
MYDREGVNGLKNKNKDKQEFFNRHESRNDNIDKIITK